MRLPSVYQLGLLCNEGLAELEICFQETLQNRWPEASVHHHGASPQVLMAWHWVSPKWPKEQRGSIL